MKSLTSSCSLFAGIFNNGRLSWPEHCPRKSEVQFIGHKIVSNFPLSQCVASLRSNATHSLSFLSSSRLSSAFNLKALSEIGESQIVDPDESKTVRVRFRLQKECLFGEQFFIIGDEPILGLWGPACAVPLDWSNGHMWVCELELPVGKVIQFKFFLKLPDGCIFWQPDPDRIFQTWETKNTVTVFEDWDNPELQSIVEEEPILDETKVCMSDTYVMPLEEKQKEPIIKGKTINSYDKNSFQKLEAKGNGAVIHGCSEELVDATSTLIEGNIFGPNNDTENLDSYEGDAVQAPVLSSTSWKPLDKEKQTLRDDKCISNEMPIQEPYSASSGVDSTDYKKRSSTTNAAIGEDGFKGHNVLRMQQLLVSFSLYVAAAAVVFLLFYFQLHNIALNKVAQH